jgi:hypothetical protein
MTHDKRSALLSALADAAIALAGSGCWRQASLPALVRGASGAQGGISLAACLEAGITRDRVREELERRLDRAMLAAADEAGETGGRARDRLFEVLMGRFDALEEARPAWTTILMDEHGAPGHPLARAPRRALSARWALEAAGIATLGAVGAARCAGLARVLRRAEEAWLQDGADLSRTMRTLDEGLRQGEDLLTFAGRTGERLGTLASGLVAGLGGWFQARTQDRSAGRAETGAAEPGAPAAPGADAPRPPSMH